MMGERERGWIDERSLKVRMAVAEITDSTGEDWGGAALEEGGVVIRE